MYVCTYLRILLSSPGILHCTDIKGYQCMSHLGSMSTGDLNQGLLWSYQDRSRLLVLYCPGEVGQLQDKPLEDSQLAEEHCSRPEDV